MSTTWSGDITGSVSRTYNNNFRTKTISVNGANAIIFLYDNDNLLTQAGALTIERDTQNGLITGTTIENITTSKTYNAFGEMDTYSAAFNEADIFNVEYTYDKLSRITHKTETLEGNTNTFEYIYDLAERLKEVHKNGR